VAGSTARFPVRRIFCVGRNYAAHSREMGGDPDCEEPFFFQKSPDCADGSGSFPYPPMTDDVHHEIELVAALGSGGADIAEGAALNHVWGYGVGLDMTRRDLQALAKERRQPWEAGKAADRSAQVGPVAPASAIGHPVRGAIRLRVNGTLRQDGDLDQMIWSLPEIIARLSRLFVLAAGDLIFTGTPAGVGPVARGDLMEGEIANVGTLAVRVV
jgi:fumarylpyruvate hydrolase